MFKSESRRKLIREVLSQLGKDTCDTDPKRAKRVQGREKNRKLDEKVRGTYSDEEQQLSPTGEKAGKGAVSYSLSFATRTQLQLPSLEMFLCV